MISVPNHQPRLSGNKISLFLVLLILVSGCGIFKSREVAKKPRLKSKDVTKIDVPDTKDYPDVDELDPIPVETKEDDKDDIDENDSKTDEVPAREYNISCFIPLNVDRLNTQVTSVSELNTLNYIQYYAGMKLAARKLEEEGIQLNLNVYDSKFSEAHVQKIVENQMPLSTDLIMAPFKKETITSLAVMGKEKSIPVISPWLTSKSIAAENPYYLQLRPFLLDHYYTITEHALANFSVDQIYLLGRNAEKDIRRFKFFQERAAAIVGVDNPLNISTFSELDLTAEHPVFGSQLSIPHDTVVFILPNFSSKDEHLIYNIIRRLHVDKGAKEVVIYTMPLVRDMDQISYDYFNDLSIRICTSRFLEDDIYEKEFRKDYFNLYHDFPMMDAYEGYDNLLYIGRQLSKYGKDFFWVSSNDDDNGDYLTTDYYIKPEYSRKFPEAEVIDYYENKHLMLIEYRDNHFIKINE